MSTIIQFFKSVWVSLVSALTWLVGVPATIVGSVYGLYSTFKAGISFVYRPVDGLDTALTTASDSALLLSHYINDLPDVAKIAIYSLSLNEVFNYISMCFNLFLTCTIVILTFALVGVPLYLANILLLKYSAKFIAGFMPTAYVPQFINVVADMDIPLGPALAKASKLFMSSHMFRINF